MSPRPGPVCGAEWKDLVRGAAGRQGEGRREGKPLGKFLITAYNIAREIDHPRTPTVPAAGLDREYNPAFLEDIRMQGSGRTRDGKLIQLNWMTRRKDDFTYVKNIRTASGRELEYGVSIAVDPRVIELGTWVHIDGVGRRRADDTGDRIQGKHIDVFRDVSRKEAMKGTLENVEVHEEPKVLPLQAE